MQSVDVLNRFHARICDTFNFPCFAELERFVETLSESQWEWFHSENYIDWLEFAFYRAHRPSIQRYTKLLLSQSKRIRKPIQISWKTFMCLADSCICESTTFLIHLFSYIFESCLAVSSEQLYELLVIVPTHKRAPPSLQWLLNSMMQFPPLFRRNILESKGDLVYRLFEVWFSGRVQNNFRFTFQRLNTFILSKCHRGHVRIPKEQCEKEYVYNLTLIKTLLAKKEEELKELIAIPWCGSVKVPVVDLLILDYVDC